MSAIKRDDQVKGILFIAPAAVLAIIFFIGPLVAAFLLSFREYSLLDGGPFTAGKWVGIDNYIKAFHDKTFIAALSNTFWYVFITVPVKLSIALALALVCNSQAIKAKGFFRTAYYIPTITSSVAISIIFLFLFKSDGLFNQILSLFGVHGKAWFNDPQFALPMVMAMATWASVGFYMVIFLAGLQSISRSLYEAANIDGANDWQQFWCITLPSLKPTIFFNLVIAMIGSFQVFDLAYVVSGGSGGPADATMTIVLYIYRTGFNYLQMGYASALAFILFFIILVLTFVKKRFFTEEAA